MVVVDDLIGSTRIRIQDPEPPGRADLILDLELFEKAWSDPAPTMANYISILGGTV